jgi:hypothetical protein
MKEQLNLLLHSIVIFLILDVSFIYLNKNNFSNIVTKVQKSEVKIDLVGLLGTYFFLFLGLYYFILSPRKSPTDAFILGLVIYGTFEFTNKIIFTNWPLYMAVIDTIWGGVLYGTTTYLTYQFVK